ncbi:MAG: type II toxin-antitoxin system prevent-host-death family antitoxin [Cohaesibacter sp.]|nr:type II toxin-antitoxin system prevent-host-death family antitoxin [Cohaesibacter sp.]MCV6601160.1 type II toxin-antitoxin system prevent-host-death family antitoxin [Cohaesibacter sp.]
MTDREFRASDLTRKTCEILHEATIAPIILTNHGKPRHVVMSVEEYERLKSARTLHKAFKTDELPQDLRDELLSGIDAQLDDDH